MWDSALPVALYMLWTIFDIFQMYASYLKLVMYYIWSWYVRKNHIGIIMMMLLVLCIYLDKICEYKMISFIHRGIYMVA